MWAALGANGPKRTFVTTAANVFFEPNLPDTAQIINYSNAQNAEFCKVWVQAKTVYFWESLVPISPMPVRTHLLVDLSNEVARPLKRLSIPAVLRIDIGNPLMRPKFCF